MHLSVAATGNAKRGGRGSFVPRPSITANTVEGLVKLLCRMTSSGRMGECMVEVGHLEAWLAVIEGLRTRLGQG